MPKRYDRGAYIDEETFMEMDDDTLVILHCELTGIEHIGTVGRMYELAISYWDDLEWDWYEVIIKETE